MVNVDLKTSGTKPSAYESRTDFSLVIIVVICLLVVGATLGTYFWRASLEKKIDIAKENIEAETNKLSSQDAKNIIDFQKRIGVANEFSDKENVLLASFTEIENLIISDVYIKSVQYQKGVLTVSIVAKDFSSLARQVASFKNSEKFSGKVDIGLARLNSDKKVEADLTLRTN